MENEPKNDVSINQSIDSPSESATSINSNTELSRAKIVGRNLVLKAKHEVVDRGLDRAITKLLNMTDNIYRELMESILKAHAQNNEYVIISKRDERRLTKDWLEQVSQRLGIRLVLSEEFHDDEGGLILSGKGYDNILTFKATAAEMKRRLSHNLFDAIINI